MRFHSIWQNGNRLVTLMLLTVIWGLIGCGGSQNNPASSRGTLQFTITWPESRASRLIPAASSSIEFTVLEKRPDENQDAPVQLAHKVVSRPPTGVNTTIVTLSDLPSVKANVIINARPSSDGSGTVQATGSTLITVTQGGTSNLNVTLLSTITRVVVTGAENALPVGNTVTLSATAYDAANNIVLTSPGKWQWSNSDSTKANGNPNGGSFPIKGLALGTTDITAIETESGKQLKVTLTIGSGPDTLSGGYYGTANFGASDPAHPCFFDFHKDGDGTYTFTFWKLVGSNNDEFPFFPFTTVSKLKWTPPQYDGVSQNGFIHITGIVGSGKYIFDNGSAHSEVPFKWP